MKLPIICYISLREDDDMKKMILCMVMILTFFMVGCSIKKEIIDSEKFIRIMSDNKFSITDATNQYDNYSHINSVHVATSNDLEYEIEFYVLDTVEEAKKMFESNKNTFEHKKLNKATIVKKNVSNYNFFSISDGDLYRYICRVENTLVYVDTTKKYKNEVKDMIKKLGY